MTSKSQLQSKIQELEAELQEFKKQLNNYKEVTIETAEPGDVLQDGSIVIKKENGLVLLAAPKNTEVVTGWTKEFSDVFEKLKEQGFTPSEWFIPTVEQLELAYKVAKEHFSAGYWSSTEYNATNGCNVNFNCGNVYNYPKSFSFCVRAFRCVTY